MRGPRGPLGRLFQHPAASAVALIPFAIATAAGYYLLLGFNSAPGAQRSAPAVWPVAEMPRAVGKPELLVFLHPLCPCSRATLHELDRDLASLSPSAPRPDIHLFFVRPSKSLSSSASDQKWTGGDLWREATAISGAITQWDDDGRLAARFGAVTSGAVLLYGIQGDLLFQGGLTAARGHEGSNLGASRLLAALETGRRVPGVSQVFGCALAIAHTPEIAR